MKGLTNVFVACIARRSICGFHWEDPHPLRSALDSAALAAFDWPIVNATFQGAPNPSHFEACVSRARVVDDAFSSQMEWMMADRSLRPSVIPAFKHPLQWFVSYPCAEHHFGWSAYPHSLQSAALSLLSLISSSVNAKWSKHWSGGLEHSSEWIEPVMDIEQLHAALLSAIFAPSPVLQQQLQQLSAAAEPPASSSREKMKIIAVGPALTLAHSSSQSHTRFNSNAAAADAAQVHIRTGGHNFDATGTRISDDSEVHSIAITPQFHNNSVPLECWFLTDCCRLCTLQQLLAAC